MTGTTPVFEINSRRFLGNKHKLLPFIKEVVADHCDGISVVADLFSGTGTVASAFADKQLITNDLLYSNYICNYAWFGAEGFDRSKLTEIISEYNWLEVSEKNYMTEHFADTYFSEADCSKIGFIREDIEKLWNTGTINARERALLIMSLLYAMDKIANTCGHYDAYRQGAAFGRRLTLAVPNASSHNNRANLCCNEDANELAKRVHADLVYLDPPYNSRQYCDAYHLLENVARWEKPEVHGVARKMDRSSMKSKYCTRSAEQAFRELIDSISARYILLSYNNMASKGHSRSNAKISDEVIFSVLSQKGETQMFETEYKAFTAGKSDIKGNSERLFLCVCRR